MLEVEYIYFYAYIYEYLSNQVSIKCKLVRVCKVNAV